MKLNFDTKYLFAYNDLSKTIFNNYSKNDIILVQEEHINIMLPFHIERCELRMIGGVIRSVHCEECASYHKCDAIKDFKDISCTPIHTAIIKNPKTNDIDLVSLNQLDFKLYTNNQILINCWYKAPNISANTTNNDIDMSKRIDSFLEYGDSL